MNLLVSPAFAIGKNPEATAWSVSGAGMRDGGWNLSRRHPFGVGG